MALESCHFEKSGVDTSSSVKLVASPLEHAASAKCFSCQFRGTQIKFSTRGVDFILLLLTKLRMYVRLLVVLGHRLDNKLLSQSIMITTVNLKT